jgi:hypothetical protein
MKKLTLVISAAAIVAAGCSGSSSSPSVSTAASSGAAATMAATPTPAPTATPVASAASGSLGMRYLLGQAKVYLEGQEGYACTEQSSTVISCSRKVTNSDDTATLTANAAGEVIKVEATSKAKVALQASGIIAQSLSTLAMFPSTFTDAPSVSVWVTGNPGLNITQDWPSVHVAITVTGDSGTLMATAK